MEIAIILAVIALALVAYFATGLILKFLLGWLPMLIGLVIGAMAIYLTSGWTAAVLGLVIGVAAMGLTNEWHSHSLYLKLEERIEKAFYIKD